MTKKKTRGAKVIKIAVVAWLVLVFTTPDSWNEATSFSCLVVCFVGAVMVLCGLANMFLDWQVRRAKNKYNQIVKRNRNLRTGGTPIRSKTLPEGTNYSFLEN